MLLGYHPRAMADPWIHRLYQKAKYEGVSAFVRSQQDRNFLLVYATPVQTTAQQVSTIRFRTAMRGRLLEKWLKEGRFREVYAVQLVRIRPDGRRTPQFGGQFQKRFRLEKASERRIKHDLIMRVSRVRLDA
jgi:hypothetical protein